MAEVAISSLSRVYRVLIHLKVFIGHVSKGEETNPEDNAHEEEDAPRAKSAGDEKDVAINEGAVSVKEHMERSRTLLARRTNTLLLRRMLKSGPNAWCKVLQGVLYDIGATAVV